MSIARFDSIESEDDFYFQGREADDVINEIAEIWNNSDLTQDEAIALWMKMHL